MRGRFLFAGCGLLLGSSAGFAQFPPPSTTQPKPFTQSTPVFPTAPIVNGPPRMLPPSMSPGQAGSPSAPSSPSQPRIPPAQISPDGNSFTPAPVTLPHPEVKIPLESSRVMTKREGGSWQVWVGPKLFRDFGPSETNATDFVRSLHDMHITEWVTIGPELRPIIEYGLVNGAPSVVGGYPKNVVAIDVQKVRVEAVRGVWCVRDDDNILFNFGLHRKDADQTVAVIQKYGFNRIGQIGYPQTAMSYLFVAVGAEAAARPTLGNLGAQMQESAMTHTGIFVPGLGFVGEMVKFDSRKLEVRRDRGDWVVAAGPDVFARFGHDEWTARDAARVIQDGRYTEFCSLAGPGSVSFFLVNGKAPTRAPFAAQGSRFSPTELRVMKLGDRYAVGDIKPLFNVGSPTDGEALIKLLKHFGFDQVCHVGNNKASMMILAKNR